MRTPPDVAVVRLCGDFDVADKPRLTEAFSSVADAAHVVVDLSRAGYIDLTVVNCLIALRNARRSPEQTIVLRGAPAPVRRLLGMIQLDTVFRLDDNDANGATGFETLREVVLTSQ